jgi:hypothetical protein
MKIRDMMIFLIFLILAVIILVLYLNLASKNFTGEVISVSSYTKAICNETNYCQDYIITCNGNYVENMRLVTGAAVQHPPEWKDPRGGNMTADFCRTNED